LGLFPAFRSKFFHPATIFVDFEELLPVALEIHKNLWLYFKKLSTTIVGRAEELNKN
jgi:hypothetical protein